MFSKLMQPKKNVKNRIYVVLFIEKVFYYIFGSVPMKISCNFTDGIIFLSAVHCHCAVLNVCDSSLVLFRKILNRLQVLWKLQLLFTERFFFVSN